MNVVKLHATGSTNDALKLRFRESVIPHLTALYTTSQSQGRGQRGTTWQSEDGKNLTFSVLVTEGLENLSIFQLNQIVSVALAEWLIEKFQIQAKVKWPNDILSVKKKLAGILIETVFKKQHLNHAIIGIGLNVNQTEFKGLPHAISMAQLTGVTYDLEELLFSFLQHLKNRLLRSEELLHKYNDYLFKHGQIADFKKDESLFKARVDGVNQNGHLLLTHDGMQQSYEIKTIKWCL